MNNDDDFSYVRRALKEYYNAKLMNDAEAFSLILSKEEERQKRKDEMNKYLKVLEDE